MLTRFLAARGAHDDRGRSRDARPAARPARQRAVGPHRRPRRSRPDASVAPLRRAVAQRALHHLATVCDRLYEPHLESYAMTDRTATLNFSDGSPSVSFPVLTGTHRSGSHRHPHAVRQDRQVHLRPGLPVDRVVQLGDHLHRRRQGRAALSRLSDRGARARAATSSRPATCCCTASCRRSTQKDEFVDARDAAHDGQRADALLHARLPPRRASDGGADRPRRRAVARSIPTR